MKETFSQSTKKEVLKNLKNLKPCCAEVFLRTVFKVLGEICFSGGSAFIEVTTENKELLDFCARLAQMYGKNVQIDAIEKARGVVYSAMFDLETAKKLSLVSEGGGVFAGSRRWQEDLASDCCKKTFVKALFLSCGSVTVPVVSDDLTDAEKTKSYHLEFVFSDEDFASVAENILSETAPFKKTRRKNSVVLYLKDGERIGDVLVHLNAMSAKLQLENVRIERDIRNTANRQSNCINANIDRTVAASEKQLAAIEKLTRTGKLPLLPQGLREMAALRKENPEASLEELARLADVSKSGAKHRLAKLILLSEE